MILIKAGEHVSEMMAVPVKKFKNFGWSGFLIIRQNVNMATNAILYCGLPPASARNEYIIVCKKYTHLGVMSNYSCFKS